MLAFLWPLLTVLLTLCFVPPARHHALLRPHGVGPTSYHPVPLPVFAPTSLWLRPCALPIPSCTPPPPPSARCPPHSTTPTPTGGGLVTALLPPPRQAPSIVWSVALDGVSVVASRGGFPHWGCQRCRPLLSTRHAMPLAPLALGFLHMSPSQTCSLVVPWGKSVLRCHKCRYSCSGCWGAPHVRILLRAVQISKLGMVPCAGTSLPSPHPTLLGYGNEQ